MMSDLAEGSKAVNQLQQNIAAAPYVGDLTKAASERKIQEDRLAAQYAPQEAANKQAMEGYKLQEEQAKVKDQQIKTLLTEAGYKADTESNLKLNDWLKTDEGQKASDVQKLEKAASFKFNAGLITEASSLQKQVGERKAREIADNVSKRLADNETLATTDAIINAMPDDKVNESLAKLPAEQLKAITDRTGEENWKNFTGKEKKEVLHRLFLSAKEQSALQLKELWAEIKEAEIEAKAERDKNHSNKVSKDRAEGKDTKGFQTYQKMDSSIVRQDKSKLEDLDTSVADAKATMDAAMGKKTNWLNDKVEVERTNATAAFNIAVQNASEGHRKHFEKRIRALKNVPDFEGKDEELESLQEDLSRYPKKKETAPPPPDASGAKGAAAPSAAVPASEIKPVVKYRTPEQYAKDTNADPNISKEAKASMIARYTAGYPDAIAEQKATSNKGAVGTQAAPIPFEPGKTVPENGKYYINNNKQIAMWDESKKKMVAGEPAPTSKPAEPAVATTPAEPVMTDAEKQAKAAKNREKNLSLPVDKPKPTAAPAAKDTSTDFTGAKSADLIREGNIDLTKRPVVKNKDGSISTVRSMSFEEDGMQILIPTVVGDKVVSDKAAIDHYHKTGEHLGMFSSVKAANAYAKKLHEEQDRMYNKRKTTPKSEKEKQIERLKSLTSDEESFPKWKKRGDEE